MEYKYGRLHTGCYTIPSDAKDAIIYVDKKYRDAVAAEAPAAVVPAKENKGKKRDCRTCGKESRKRAPSECTAPVDNVPECSNSKRSKVAIPQVKKVPAGLAGIDGTFTISVSPRWQIGKHARCLPAGEYRCVSPATI